MLNILLAMPEKRKKKNDELLESKRTLENNRSSFHEVEDLLAYKVEGQKARRGDTRDYLPATKEWSNSIYTYDQGYMKLLAITENGINKLIKSYFFLRSTYMENIFENKSKRHRLLSVNRTYVSKSEMKHTNNKVTITVYTYNKEKNYFLFKLKSLRKMLIFRNNSLFLINLNKMEILKKIYKVSFLIYNILKKKDLLKIYVSNKQVFEDFSVTPAIGDATQKNESIKEPSTYASPMGGVAPLPKEGRGEENLPDEKLFEKLNDTIRWKSFEKQFFLSSFSPLHLKVEGEEAQKEFTANPGMINVLQSYVKKLYIYYLKKSIAVMSINEMLYLHYNQILFLNSYKFNLSYIHNEGFGLDYLTSKIYNKEVELNIVDLKYSHLNSDIFSDSISTKLNDRKKKVLRVLKKALNLVKLMPSRFRHKSTSNLVYSEDSIEKIGLNLIKNKGIKGVRLEASGRLTMRKTAARSISKLKYIGNLRNISSFDNKISSVMLRGHVRSNIQYTNINSKTPNGAYGLKAWVSSY